VYGEESFEISLYVHILKSKSVLIIILLKFIILTYVSLVIGALFKDTNLSLNPYIFAVYKFGKTSVLTSTDGVVANGVELVIIILLV
jgi:type IV secretory pathway TrbF-like protein